jgi:hypothetical protein
MLAPNSKAEVNFDIMIAMHSHKFIGNKDSVCKDFLA